MLLPQLTHRVEVPYKVRQAEKSRDYHPLPHLQAVGVVSEKAGYYVSSALYQQHSSLSSGNGML